MPVDPKKLADWRREIAVCKEMDDESCIEPLLRLRDSIRAEIGPTPAELPSREQMRKAQLIRQTLVVNPIELPDDSPEELGHLAERLEGRVWSLELVRTIDAELAALTSNAQKNKAEIEKLTAQTELSRRRLGVLVRYLELMNALAQKGAAANRSA